MDRLKLCNVGKEGCRSAGQDVKQAASKLVIHALQKAQGRELQNLKDEAGEAPEEVFN